MCRSALNPCARSIYLQSLLSPCLLSCVREHVRRCFDIVTLFSLSFARVFLLLLLHVLHDAVRMCWCSLQLALSKLMHNDSRIHHWLWHLIAFLQKLLYVAVLMCILCTCFMSSNYMQFFRRQHLPPRAPLLFLYQSLCVCFFSFLAILLSLSIHCSQTILYNSYINWRRRIEIDTHSSLLRAY